MGQVDRGMGLVGNVAVKYPCRLATTASLGANMADLAVIDGVQTVAGDRVLRKDEATGALNGIWVADTGVWNRAQDFDGVCDAADGTLVVVTHGAASARQVFQLVTPDPIVIGTTALTFTGYNAITFPAALAASGGSALVGFLQSGTGAVPTDLQTAVREIKSVTHFFTPTQRANAIAGTGNVWDGIKLAVDAALAGGFDLWFPPTPGAYIMDTNFPIGKMPPVAPGQQIDYKGMTIYGSGRQSLIKTVPASDGADVFAISGSKNLTIRNLAVASVIPGGSIQGSNGFSVGYGCSNVTVEDCHCFVLPYVTGGGSIFGGSAFTIQQATDGSGNSLGMRDIRFINNTADGGAYGLHYIGSGAAASGADPITGVVFRGNRVKGFYAGVDIETGFPGAESALPTQSFSVLGNKAIDCQRGMNFGGSTGINATGNEIMSTLTNNHDPATGVAWVATDAVLNGIRALTLFNCNIVNNIVYEAACTNFMSFGGGFSAHTNTPSLNCNVSNNSMFGVASGIGMFTEATYGGAQHCNIIGNNITGFTGNAIDPLLYQPSQANTVVDETGTVLRSATLIAQQGANFSLDSDFNNASTVGAPVAPWTPSAATWAVAGGKGVATLAVTGQSLFELVSLTAGHAYTLSVVVTGYAGTGTGGFYVIGTVASGFTDNLILAAQWSGNGTFTRTFIPNLTGVYRIGLGSTGGGGTEYNASHDTFTIKKVPLLAGGDVVFTGTARVVLQTFANNAAALAGGLMPGQLYRVNAATTPEPIYVVHV